MLKSDMMSDKYFGFSGNDCVCVPFVINEAHIYRRGSGVRTNGSYPIDSDPLTSWFGHVPPPYRLVRDAGRE